MFQTIKYKGHYINLAYNPSERIEALLEQKDGGYRMIPAKTFLGAKRLITKHIKETNK